MIWVRSPGVLLQSEWPWQPSDTNTFFLFIFVFLCTRSFFKEKNITDLFCFKRAHCKAFIFYIFFHGARKPCNDSYVSELHWWRARPETSGDWTHKHHKKALLFIILFLYWTFLYLLFLIAIFSFVYLFWHTLTARDDARDRDANSSRQMTSLDAIFCRGNKSSSRSLARCSRRKHKKSTAREKFELDL